MNTRFGCALNPARVVSVLPQHGQRHELSARCRFSAQVSFFQLCVLLQSPTSSIVEFVCLGPTSSHRSPTLLSLFPTAVLLATKQAARPESKLLRSAADLPSLRRPPVGHQRHCHAVWTMVTFSSTPFSQASRAKSVVARARSLQLQHSMFSTCTIQLCTGLDSCHMLDAYTHLIQDLSNLAALVSMPGFWALR